MKIVFCKIYSFEHICFIYVIILEISGSTSCYLFYLSDFSMYRRFRKKIFNNLNLPYLTREASRHNALKAHKTAIILWINCIFVVNQSDWNVNDASFNIVCYTCTFVCVWATLHIISAPRATCCKCLPCHLYHVFDKKKVAPGKLLCI